MAWLQAFGVLLLPGFRVGSPSLQVPGHPTSTCDASVKVYYMTVDRYTTDSRPIFHRAQSLFLAFGALVRPGVNF